MLFPYSWNCVRIKDGIKGKENVSIQLLEFCNCLNDRLNERKYNMVNQIKTDRLRIIPFDMNYLEAYYAEFNKEIVKYQYPDPFESISDAQNVLQGFVDQMAQDEMLFLTIITSDGDFVGGVEVHGLQEQYPELGIWIKKLSQQKGYAYEALSSVLKWVDSEYQKDWYVYEADVRNKGSIRLVEKFDYKKEETYEFTTETGKELVFQKFLIRSNK